MWGAGENMVTVHKYYGARQYKAQESQRLCLKIVFLRNIGCLQKCIRKSPFFNLAKFLTHSKIARFPANIQSPFISALLARPKSPRPNWIKLYQHWHLAFLCVSWFSGGAGEWVQKFGPIKKWRFTDAFLQASNIRIKPFVIRQNIQIIFIQ